jgi:ATP-dependent RNA helicase DeaD
MSLLNDCIAGKKITVGRIDLMKNFSFFEVKEADAQKVVQAMNGIKAFGRRLTVETSQPSPSDDRQKKIEKANYKKKSRYK